MPIMTDCLRESSRQDRLVTLTALAAIGPSAEVRLTSLKPLVREIDGIIRIAAALALWLVATRRSPSNAWLPTFGIANASAIPLGIGADRHLGRNGACGTRRIYAPSKRCRR